MLLATGGALATTEELARHAGATDVASLRRQISLVNKPQLRLLVAATRTGAKQCAAVAGPSVQVPLQAR